MSTSVLVADPPWSFGDKLPGETRGAEKNYDVMSQEDIEHFPLPPLADSAILFLWRVSSQVEEAYRVVRAWGFVPKSEIVWVKTAQDEDHEVLNALGLAAEADPDLAFGMGHYTRAAHETCIVAVRGKYKVASRSVRSVFFAPRGRHSEKPDAFYDMVEKLVLDDAFVKEGVSVSDVGIVELFARRQRPGWRCYGNEMDEAHPQVSGASTWQWAHAAAAVAECCPKCHAIMVEIPNLYAAGGQTLYRCDVCPLWLNGDGSKTTANVAIGPVEHDNPKDELGGFLAAPKRKKQREHEPGSKEAALEVRDKSVRRARAEGLVPPEMSYEQAWVEIALIAPPGWYKFEPEPENLSALSAQLAKRGVTPPDLKDISRWDPADRAAAQEWANGRIHTLPPIIASLQAGDEPETRVAPSVSTSTADEHRKAKEAREQGKKKRGRKSNSDKAWESAAQAAREGEP